MSKILPFLIITLFVVSVAVIAIYGTGGEESETINSHVETMNSKTLEILKDANDTIE